MNKNLKLISVKDMPRKEWLAQRMFGIGGSDVGSILGLDRFKPAIKLFHQKIGMWETDESDNIAAYAGRISEEHIYYNYWRYWNHQLSEKDAVREMLDNATSNTVLRKAKRVQAIIINEKYPWLRANIDYEINKTPERDNGILELKTGNSKYWSQYEAELPTPYIFQVQLYMLVCEYKYAELFGLLDGRFPKMFHFDFNPSLAESIVEQTKNFWDNVLKGQEIMKMNIPFQEKIALVGEIEPSIDATDSSEDYLKDFYKQLSPEKSMLADDSLESLRIDYRLMHKKVTSYGEDKKMKGNELRKAFIDCGVNEILFEDGKKATWKNNRLSIPKCSAEDVLL